jgi:hypothetical protein
MFKVQPRYKARSDGDAVRAGDSIVLKSVDAQGQYLAFTAESFTVDQLVGTNGLQQIDDREASCSAVQQAWQIEVMSLATPTVQSAGAGKKSVAAKQVLHIGDVVRCLFLDRILHTRTLLNATIADLNPAYVWSNNLPLGCPLFLPMLP